MRDSTSAKHRGGGVDASLAAGILEVTPVIVLALDPEGCIEYANPYFEALTGRSLAEFRGLDWFSTFLPERDRERIREFFRTSLGDVPVRGHVNAIVTSSGTERMIEWNGRVLRDESGKISNLVSVGKDVTDELRAAREHRETERRLASVFENTFDAQVLLAVEPGNVLRIVAVNRRYVDELRSLGFDVSTERLVGMSRDELLALFNLRPDDATVEVERSRYLEAIEGGHAVRFQQTLPLGREAIHTEVSIAPVLDESGACKHVVWTSRDVTERVRGEERIRASEAGLRHILDGMFAFVGLYDLEGAMIEVNRAPLEAAGLTREDVLGRPFWETYWWSYSEEAQAKIRQALARAAHGEIVRDDFVVRIRDGRLITSDAMFGPLVDGSGRVYGVVGCGVDVTERKEAEQALERAQSLLLDAEHLAKLGSWSWNVATGEVHWSPEMYRQYGVDPAEHPNPTFELAMSRIHPDDIARVQENTERGLACGVISPVEYRLVCGDGGPRVMRGEGHVTDGPHGKVVRGFVQDIAERKRYEEQILAQLAEKDVLLREIHHRVKNNLQVVSSLLFLQQQSVASEEVITTLRESRARVAAMGLVHEKLYSPSANLSHIDIADYARDLAASLLTTYGVDDARIAVVVRGEGLSLALDEAIPCGLILNELISNAFKHAYPRGRKGAVSVDVGSEGGSFVLTVSDDGIGMPAGVGDGRPTSLGLRLIERLARQLGGTIERSGPPGTSYRLVAPLARAVPRRAATRWEREGRATRPG